MTSTIKIHGELDRSHSASMPRVDLAVVACGYESRARAFAEDEDFGGAEKIALVFQEHQVLAFQENSAVMLEKGFELVSVPDTQLRDWIIAKLASLSKPEGELAVFVDISSQSRSKLAAIVEALNAFGGQERIRAYFGYTLAAFAEPSRSKAPNVAIGPVSPFFAGWTKDPDLPVSLIVGLGHEPDRALGAVEYLEPATVWALMPHSSEPKYDVSLSDANKQLLQQIGDDRVLTYDVEDPNATLALMTALVAYISRDSSALILSSGPKVLVLLALLVACMRRDVAVWRVSAGIDDPPIDRLPTGNRLVLECEFSPSAIGRI